MSIIIIFLLPLRNTSKHETASKCHTVIKSMKTQTIALNWIMSLPLIAVIVQSPSAAKTPPTPRPTCSHPDCPDTRFTASDHLVEERPLPRCQSLGYYPGTYYILVHFLVFVLSIRPAVSTLSPDLTSK